MRQDQALNDITSSFAPNMSALTDSNLANLSLGFSLGDQRDLGDKKLGYIAAINYKNTTTFYEDARDAAYVKPSQNNEFELTPDTRFEGPLGITDAQLSGLAGVSLKGDKNKFRLQAMHVQNGTQRAALRTRIRSNNNSNTSLVDN